LLGEIIHTLPLFGAFFGDFESGSPKNENAHFNKLRGGGSGNQTARPVIF
jgi:hypothetical protein